MEEHGKISFVTAVLMNINVIVGVGIYFLPQMMVQKAGAFSYLSWLTAGLLLLPVVWTVATAARLFPGSGGFYNYGTSAFGSTIGFTGLWAYMLGFLATAAAQLTFLKQLMVVNAGVSSIAVWPIVANLILVLVIGLLNLLDVEIIGKIQGFVTILKLLPMISVVILFAFYWNGSIAYNVADLSSLGATIPMAIFGYWGFESCTSTSHLIKGGSAKASGVMLSAFFISATLYALFHFGITHIMGIDAIATQGAVGFTSFLGLSSAGAKNFVGGAVVVALILALFNAVYGVSLGNSANMFSLADKGHLIGSSFFTKTNKFARPYVIVFFQAAIVFLLMTFVANDKVLVSLSNFGLITALMLTVFSVLKVQIASKQGLFSWVISLAAIAACVALGLFTWQMLGVSTVERSMNVIPFLLGLIAGLCMFYYKKKCSNIC